jgi:perosamine synthetase
LARAYGVGPGDEVLLPSFTFAASVNCILYQGATPVFVDIQPDTYNLDPRDMEAKITPRTRAVIPVDVFGHPADWQEIEQVARKHGLAIIDDSCEALGALYRGRPIGSFGNAAAFAFYANKQITTGEGGMIVTDDGRVAKLCRSWRNQGRGEMGAWLVYEELGYNYRMTEMSAALGVSQMLRLDEILEKRAAVAQRYTEYLSQLDWLHAPVVRDYVRPSWFVYVVTLAEGIDREKIIRHLDQRGIPSRAYFPPVHTQPYFRRWQEISKADHHWDWRPGSLPVTESISRRTLALPFHTNLTAEEQERVVAALGAV